MEIQPVAHFCSPLSSKFGIPRQGGLARSLVGRIVFEPPYRHEEAVRGLEAFSHLWMIWEFSANREEKATAEQHLTVRPPRLGGNERVGVFASRSPFRPNRLGLTCAKIEQIVFDKRQGPVIYVSGADLMDGTPIYDVKPYVRYADSHPEAQSGFVDQREWQPLEVEMPDSVARQFAPDEQAGLREVLAQDPRPSYHHDPDRLYGMPFAGRDVRFRVADGRVVVVEVR